MPRKLTASDRKNLIKLASSLPKGSPERKAILAGLKVSGSNRSKTIGSWIAQLRDWKRQAQRAKDALRDMNRKYEGVDLYDLRSWSEDDQREELAEFADDGKLKWDMRNDASAEIMLAVINTSIIEDLDRAIDALDEIA